MNEPVYTFEPTLGGNELSLYGGILVAFLALAGMVLMLRRKTTRKNRNYQMLGAMWLFFIFLISLSTAFFSWMAQRKIGPVYIYDDSIETPYGRAPFEAIRNASIETEKEHSLINPNLVRDEFRLLIIEMKDGPPHVLSGENYDLDDIMSKLRRQVKTWEQE